MSGPSRAREPCAPGRRGAERRHRGQSRPDARRPPGPPAGCGKSPAPSSHSLRKGGEPPPVQGDQPLRCRGRRGSGALHDGWAPRPCPRGVCRPVGVSTDAGRTCTPASLASATGGAPGTSRREVTGVGSGLKEPRGPRRHLGNPRGPSSSGSSEAWGEQKEGERWQTRSGCREGRPGRSVPTWCRPSPLAPQPLPGPSGTCAGGGREAPQPPRPSRVDLGAWATSRSRAPPALAWDPCPRSACGCRCATALSLARLRGLDRGAPCGLAGILAPPQPEWTQAKPSRRRERGEAAPRPQAPVSTGACPAPGAPAGPAPGPAWTATPACGLAQADPWRGAPGP